MDQAKDTENSITAIDTPHDILVSLENTLGPIRLVIIATESGAICSHHHIGLTGAEDLRSHSPDIYTTQVEVFHKNKTYQYIIDRGSSETTSQFTREQRDTIIDPILRIYIERLEYAFFSAHADHGACIRQYEEREDRDRESRDYSVFIERVLSDTTLMSNSDEIADSDDYMRAIDMARLVMSHYRDQTHSTIDEFYEQVDTIV
jgi:hypothetical protein